MFHAISFCTLFVLLLRAQASNETNVSFQAHYVLGVKGADTCPTGSRRVNESECPNAAASLKIEFAGVCSSPVYFHGCHYYDSQTCIRYNRGEPAPKPIEGPYISLVCVQMPTPPPSPQPRSSWPTFASLKALQADPWSAYYKAVYGELPSNGYPLKVGTNWMIYDQLVVKAKLKRIPASIGDCPTADPPEGQRYAINNQYSPRFSNWIWHQYPYEQLAHSTWVEIIHQADPFGDEHYGAWFMFAPGSGIYFNTGSTVAFKEHSEAYTKFDIKPSGDMNEDLCKAAAGQGLDSLQFLAHVDHVNYQCDTQNTGNAGLAYMGVEIVGVKLAGTFACTSQQGAPPVIKAGWGGSKTCACDNSKDFLNCKDVPELSPTMSSDDAIYNKITYL